MNTPPPIGDSPTLYHLLQSLVAHTLLSSVLCPPLTSVDSRRYPLHTIHPATRFILELRRIRVEIANLNYFIHRL